MTVHAVRQQLRTLVHEVKKRAYVPYSGRPEAVVLLLADGDWIPGVRVESASFSLTIPPLQNAWTTAIALGRRDVVAVVFSEAIDAGTWAFIEGLPIKFEVQASDWLAVDARVLPSVRKPLAPFCTKPITTSEQGVQEARRLGVCAWAPHSHFPVGCLLQLEDGRCIPGVNVEHPDWTRTLCAERNALGTAVSYGVPASSWRALFLSCVKDVQGTPCGACRQLLAEHCPSLAVWMDRGDLNPPQLSVVESLLPGFFMLQ